jgi:importin subunit alpha-1
VFIQHPVLRIFGNIVSGDALQTQQVINAGILSHLHRLIFAEKKAIRKDACWIVSNIAAGTEQQVEALINNNFLPSLIRVVHTDDSEV